MFEWIWYDWAGYSWIWINWTVGSMDICLCENLFFLFCFLPSMPIIFFIPLLQSWFFLIEQFNTWYVFACVYESGTWIYEQHLIYFSSPHAKLVVVEFINIVMYSSNQLNLLSIQIFMPKYHGYRIEVGLTPKTIPPSLLRCYHSQLTW